MLWLHTDRYCHPCCDYTQNVANTGSHDDENQDNEQTGKRRWNPSKGWFDGCTICNTEEGRGGWGEGEEEKKEEAEEMLARTTCRSSSKRCCSVRLLVGSRLVEVEVEVVVVVEQAGLELLVEGEGEGDSQTFVIPVGCCCWNLRVAQSSSTLLCKSSFLEPSSSF